MPASRTIAQPRHTALMPLAEVARHLKQEGILTANKGQLVRWATVGTAPIIEGRSTGKRIKLATKFVSGMRYTSVKNVLKWVDDVDKAQRRAEVEHQKKKKKRQRA